jgi:hypothetical protein
VKKEIVKKIEVLESGELILILENKGQSSYQFVYREAAGVYWNPSLNGFITTEPKDWSYSKWFSHIVEVVNQTGIQLALSDKTEWIGLDSSDKEIILTEYSIQS